jgi:hypothetical protein
MRKFGQIILNLDRRVIYTLVLICVIVPLVMPLELEITPTPEVISAFEDIEALETGSAVIISCDYGPNSMPETHPMYKALLHQCFRSGLRPIIVTLVVQGPGLASRGLRDVLQSTDTQGNLLYPGLREGVDYAFLGYRPGGTAVMLGVGQSFTTTYETDYDGDVTSEMPLFREIAALGDAAYIFDIASVGYPPYWLAYASERENVPMSACVTAVSAAEYYPYYRAGQFRGLVGGMKGTAEYEQLVGMEAILGRVPDATRGMDSQSVVHVLIVLAVIIANVFYFLERRWEAEERRAR